MSGMEIELRSLLLFRLPAMTPDTVNWGEHPNAAIDTYIVLSLIDMNSGLTQQGRDGIEVSRVQVDCYAPTWLEARTLGQEVQDAVDCYDQGGFHLIAFDSLRMTRENDENDGERMYRASLDFITNWSKRDG